MLRTNGSAAAGWIPPDLARALCGMSARLPAQGVHIFVQPAAQYVSMPRSRAPARGAEGCLVCPGLAPDRHWYPEALSLGRPRPTPLGSCEAHFVHGRQTPYYPPSSGRFLPRPIPAVSMPRITARYHQRGHSPVLLLAEVCFTVCNLWAASPTRRSTARSSAPGGWRGSWPARRLTRWQEN
jgi:hypothetical protein